VAQDFDFHNVRGRHPKARSSGRFEGEQLPMNGRSRPQPMESFGKQWSANGQLLWDGAINDKMETAFELGVGGRFDITIQLTLAPHYGRFDVLLDGEVLAKDVDTYDPTVTLAKPIEVTSVSLEEGEHQLTFVLVDRNEKAKMIPGDRLLMGLDYLELKRLDELPQKEEQETSAAEEPESNSQASPLSQSEFHASLRTHCYQCHSDDEVEGDVALDKLSSESSLLSNIKATQKIREVITQHKMPPKDEEQPSQAMRSRWIATLDAVVDKYLAEHRSTTPVIMRRMNRYEYNNAVRDLLGMKGDIYPLPEKTLRADTPYFDPASGRFPTTVTVGNRTLGKNQVEKQVLTGVSPFSIDLQAEGGFNNRGEELSVSPLLLESFLKLGQSIVGAPEFNSYCERTTELFQVAEETTREERSALSRERLKTLLERAFRKPIETKTIDRYHSFFLKKLDKTKSFEASMKRTVAAILSSPRFIYIAEPLESVHGEAALDAWELASRLSFFLWSTIPDEELLKTARNGTLAKPEVLEAQVRRMLESPKSQALSQNFARQWLRLDQLVAAVPDFERYEAYYSRIGCEQWKLGLQSMIEPLLLFESVMVEDRSIMLLIDSNYTYRSRELQSWYRDDVPFDGKQNRNRFDTFQQQFRRTKLEDRREGGVITTAATLTMTSAPLRTSPIVRGAWVATAIFNQPPPPPPDDVPSIEADEKAIEAKGLTLRERLVEHQENKTCASCHSKIDPLGFALENFDAVGRWREKYNSGREIDSSGKLFGEAEFKNVVELKEAILSKPEWFMRAYCEHMLSYALSRELEVSDEPAIDNIVAKVKAANGQFTIVVREIVMSRPFRFQASTSKEKAR